MDVKEKYINFFEKKGHEQISSASLIPDNDPTSLFITAGMQPLVPYLMGEVHPKGNKLVNYQKCVRTNDLDEVGDKTHHTFFEMLGNWSLGNYFKEESIKYSFEFLTKDLGISVDKLAVSVFKGNDTVGADEFSANVWRSLGIPNERIAYLGEEDNWWGPVSDTGPCGPDTEIFYYRSDEKIPTHFDPEDDNWVEIWNNVFMEFNKNPDGSYTPLKQQNVDTGMGVERITSILEDVDDNYLSSIWLELINKIMEISGCSYEEFSKEIRIIADHIRAVVFIASDPANIRPSNSDQGYILRRLIRRVIRYAKKINIDINSDFEKDLAKIVIKQYSKYYDELKTNENVVYEVLENEKNKFSKTLEKGLREFDKIISTLDNNIIDSEKAFKLYDTYGFPIELTIELANEKEINVDLEGFKKKFKEHQEKSRQGVSDKFKGGLSSDSLINAKYHTATHLLNAALKEVLGEHVCQKGSNINEQRLRFDFPHPEKVTKEQLEEVEKIVNKYISMGMDVSKVTMNKEEALKTDAEAAFIDRYGDNVDIYTIGHISKEFCGGPHVKNTSELGEFKIKKEESVGSGLRRIKAVLK